MKRTIERITRAAMLAVAFMLCATSAWAGETTTSITAPAAWGGTKPKAVWLGDFPATGNDSTRNGYTLNLNGNATTDGIVTIGGSSSTGGVTVKTTAGKTAVGVVAGIKGVASSSAIRILMSSYQTDSNDNRTMVGFKANESKFSGFTSGPAYFNSNNISWTSNANTNYFAFSYQGASGTGRGTYAYLNGSDTIYNNAGTLAYSDASVLGVTFGGAHNAKNYNMDGAVISYAAVLDATSATDLSPALKFWSLTDISSIEVHKTTGTIDGGSGRGITLNLNGETVTVSGVKTAAAVFVQDDTTLDFSGDATSRLDISGPIYVADGKTLTIKLGTLSNGYRRPITMGSCFASNNQIQVKYTTPDGSVTSIIPTAVSITAFTQTEQEQAAQAAFTISDYTQWSYATDVFTWISPSSASGSDVALWKYIKFDVSTGQTAVGATAIEGGNNTAYDTAATPSKKFWWYWCYSGSSDFPGYSAPGLVARFVPDTNEITHLKAIPAGFGPLTIGGLIVENGATGYSFEADDSSKVRWTTLGDPTGQVETRFTILEDFAINRNGSLNLVGTSYFDIAAGKVFSLNAGRANDQQPVMRATVGAAADNGEITSGIVDGGCLKMHGEGQISATKLTASSACLDYSDLSASRAVPYIDAQLVVDSNTSYKFPALAGAATYQLAYRLSDTSGITGDQTFSIGGHEYQAPLAFNESNGTVVFPAVAMLAGSETAVNWSDISWDAKPATIDDTTVAVLNVTGNRTLVVDSATHIEKLTVNIAEGATLTLQGASRLTLDSGIDIRGDGTLTIDFTGVSAPTDNNRLVTVWNVAINDISKIRFANVPSDAIPSVGADNIKLVWKGIYTDLCSKWNANEQDVVACRSSGAQSSLENISASKIDTSTGNYGATATLSTLTGKFADNNIGAVLCFDEPEYVASIVSHSDYTTLGGLFVTVGGSSLSKVSKQLKLGHKAWADGSNRKTTWYVLTQSFDMSGFSTAGDNPVYGEVNMVIYDGATLTLPSPSGIELSTDRNPGATLKMSGGGSLSGKVGTKSGEKVTTLDYSALAPNRGTAFIQGELGITQYSKFKFPSGVGATYPVATSVTGASAIDYTFVIGSNEYLAPLTFSDGNAVFPAVATLDGEVSAVNWSTISWDAKPVTIGSSDVVTLNITGNITLNFDSSVNIGKLVLNISAGAELTISRLNNLTAANGVDVRGTGTLKVDTAETFTGNITFENSATLAVGSGDTLSVTGNITISDGSTLNFAPSATSDSSSTIVTATAISGTVTLTAPTDASNTYIMEKTGTALTLKRTPIPAYTYNAAQGNWNANGFNGDFGNITVTDVRVGPSETHPIVYVISSDFKPYTAFTKPSGSFSFAIYADVSKMLDVSDGGAEEKRVMLDIGNASGNVTIYREGNYVKAANVTANTGTIQGETSVPVTAGYHLYTVVYDSTTKKLTLYKDDGTGANAKSESAALESLVMNDGFQIGSTHGALPTTFWRGDNMAFAAVVGYNAPLTDGEIANLATYTYVATDGTTFSHTINNTTDATFTLYSIEQTGNNYLGGSLGTYNIPSGQTVTVPALRFLNRNQGTDSVTLNVAGTLNISTSYNNKNVYSRQYDGYYEGVLFGHYYGSGTYNVTGTLDASNVYIEMGYDTSGGTSALTISKVDNSAGIVKTKGFFAKDGRNNTSVTITDGGTLEVSDIPADGGSITKNFGNGTFRVKASVTETRAINFTGTSSAPTTLDPYGNTLTMSDGSLTGSGYITVASSAEGETKGSVVFGANASFGGKVILTNANRDLIDISDYKGGILYSGTEAATLAKLNEFGGTVYFTSDVDASSIDLSGATVNLAENCTLTALVGNEGKLVLDSGAVVTLKVTNDIVNYEGHVPVVSGSGTVTYYNTDTLASVAGVDHVNGNNLLPYYQIWEVNEGVGSGNVSTPSNWKGNAVPGTGKNVAFHVTGDSQITVTVDSTITFGEVQVYGEGTVLFEKSGENTLICNTAFHVTDGTAVRIIDGSVYVMGAAGFKIADGSKVVYAVSDKSTEYNFMTKVSGAGSFWLDGGVVTFNTATGLAELTGGLRVLAGTIAKTTANDGNASGFGPQDSSITVETGAQLDLGNTANICYSITIDPGVEDSELPVLTCSTTIDQNSKQMSALTVNADAIIDVPATKEFGLVASSYATAPVDIKKGVTLTKKGGGKFLMASAQISNIANGDITVAPKLVIEEGSVEVANGYNGGASACTLSDGATFDVEVCDDATLVVKKGFAATSLTVAGAGTVDVASSGALTLTSVSGAGTVKWTGKQPDGDKWNTCSSWTGTNVVMSAGTTEITDLRPDLWGREGSFVVMKNLKGYLGNNNNTVVNAKVILENGDNGYAYNVSNGYRINWYFREISGNGDIVDTHQVNTGSNGGAQQFIFKNATDFTGSVRINDTASGKHHTKRFTFSSGSYDSAADSAVYGVIKVLADGAAVIGNGESWKADYGASIAGTVTLKGGATIDCPVTATGSAKIILADTPLTISSTLTATSLIIDPGEIALNTSTPTVLITGLTNTDEPNVTGITVPGCTVSVGGTSGAYTIQATLKSTSWTGESGAWSASSFNGGDLTTEGQDIAFLLSSSDAVTVTLDGTRAPANVTFNGGTTGYTLKGGTFAPSGTVTIESGAVTIESEATGTYVVKSGATLSLTNATVTSVSGAGTLNIPTGGVVTLASANAIDGIASLGGEGTLVMPSAALPGSSLQTLLKNSNWKGTLAMSDLKGDTTTQQFKMGDYGNDSSKIQFAECIISYPINDNNDAYNGKVILVGDKALQFTVDNGYSNNKNLLGELTGSGTLASTGNNTQLYMFKSSPEFFGNIATSGKRIMFVNEASDGTANYASDSGAWVGTIRIASNASASIGANANWVAYNGFGISGTLIVKGAGSYLEHNNSGTKGITFNNGATIRYDALATLRLGEETLRTPTVASDAIVKISFGEDVDLASGTKLISWGGAPQGSFTFDDGAGGSTSSKVVDGVRYVLVSESDGLYLKARYGTIFSVW